MPEFPDLVQRGQGSTGPPYGSLDRGRRKDSGYAKKLVAKREKMVISPQAKENPHSRLG